MTKDKVIEILGLNGFSNVVIKKVLKDVGLINEYGNNFFDYDNVIKIIKDVDEFYRDNYTFSEIFDITGETRDRLNQNLIWIPIPKGYNHIHFKTTEIKTKKATNKIEFERNKVKFEKSIIRNDEEFLTINKMEYISIRGCLRLMGINDINAARSILKGIKNHFNNTANVGYYNYKSVIKLLSKCEKLSSDFMFSDEISDSYKKFLEHCSKVKIDAGSYVLIAKLKGISENYNNKSKYMYAKADVESIYESYTPDMIKIVNDFGSKEYISKDFLVSEFKDIEDTRKFMKFPHCLSNEAIRKILNQLGIKNINYNGYNYYRISELEDLMKLVREFYNNHYLECQVMEKPLMSESVLKKYDVKPVIVPNGYSSVLFAERFPVREYKLYLKAYKKDDIDQICNNFNYDDLIKLNKRTDLKSVPNEFISLSKCMDLLNLLEYDDESVSRVLSYYKIQKIYVSHYKYYRKSQIINLKEKVDVFTSTTLSVNDIKEKFDNINYMDFTRLKKVRTPYGFSLLTGRKKDSQNKQRNKTNRYTLESIHELLELKEKESAFNKQISIGDKSPLNEVLAKYFMNSKKSYWKFMESEYKLRFIEYNHEKYFYNHDLELLDNLRKEFVNKYFFRYEIKKMFNTTNIPYELNKLPKVEVPVYMLGSIELKYQCSIAMDKEVVNSFFNNTIRINNSIEHEDMKKVFYMKLDNLYNWYGFDSMTKFTKLKWFEFIEESLIANKNKRPQIKVDIINSYIRSTVKLTELLRNYNKNELYKVTSSEINLFFRGIDNINLKKILFRFIKSFYYVARTNKISINFRLAEIDKKNIYRSNSIDTDNSEEIYDPEEYFKIFDYCLETNKHIKKSLNEIEQKDFVDYCSTWFFVMLHLNNAWRKTDINLFPIIEINDILLDLNISSYQWFNDNNVDLNTARKIISRIIQYEIDFTKVNIEGHFFCSDELAIPLATSIIILTLYNNAKLEDHRDTLLTLSNKYSVVDKTRLKYFFKDFDKIEKFKFIPKKMNHTIMTFTTFLRNLTDNVKDLEYAKIMRSHKSIKSTQFYVNLHFNDIDKLSKQLFERGEFGYISDLLVTRISTEKMSFYQKTEKIKEFKSCVGDVVKINKTLEFFNDILYKQNLLEEELKNKSFEECVEILQEIYVGKMVSKDSEDIQCFKGKENCPYKNKIKCKHCQYRIVTIYYLFCLGYELLTEIRDYQECKSEFKKEQLKREINYDKYILSEAVQKYGREYVYSCMGIDRTNLIDMLSYIPDERMLNAE